MKTPKKYPEQEEKLFIVNEPIALYYSSPSIKSNVLDNLSKSSKDIFNEVVAKTGLTIKILAESIFEITPKTFIKYKNNETKIPSRITEIAIEITTLYELGNQVFGSSDVFNSWLDKENAFFNNKKPSNFLNTSTGIHLIHEELKRIEFGATA